jgi:hypothetical protein
MSFLFLGVETHGRAMTVAAEPEAIAQREATDWARNQGHAPPVARVRHLNDKKKPDHWRAA